MRIKHFILPICLVVFNSQVYAFWNVSNISNVVAKGISFVMDSNKTPHVSYMEGNNTKYATCVNNVWKTFTIDTNNAVIGGTSIALDQQGYPHVAYIDRTNYLLKHAKWTGTNWSVESIDSVAGHPFGAEYDRYACLAIDSSNNIHIAYMRPDTGDPNITYLMYAKWEGIAWSTETIDTGGGCIAMVLDKTGNPNITYNKGGTLGYARLTSGSWQISVIDTTTWSGMYHSIAIDSLGNPQVAYTNYVTNVLNYARWSGAAWLKDTFYYDVRNYTSIQIDSKNNPAISFTNELYCNYMKKNGTIWNLQQFGFAGTTGGYETVLALDTNDNPFIVFSDNYGQFKYARWSNPPQLLCTNEINYTDNFVYPINGTKDTSFIFRIKYIDTDNDPPMSGYPRVIIKNNGTTVSISTMGYVSGNYKTGAIYSQNIVISSTGSNITYSIEAYDIWGASNVISGNGPYIQYSLPQLTWAGDPGFESTCLDKNSGYKSTILNFRVKYIDNDPPMQGYPKLHIYKDGSEVSNSPFVMNDAEPNNVSYSSGKKYCCSMSLPAGNYSYNIEAYDLYNLKAIGNPTNISSGPTISELNIPASGKISVTGPAERHGIINPDKGDKAQIYFQGSGIGTFKCRIYNTSGELLYEETKDNVNEGYFEWIPKGIASGIYIVRVDGPGVNIKKKLAILR